MSTQSNLPQPARNTPRLSADATNSANASAVTETEPRCPICDSAELRFFHHDGGICQQTGYNDSGEAFRCLRCGVVGAADEVELVEVQQ